nr:MAG TPA: hypothetical protein [Caudoviricetes sp.]
MRLFSFRTLVSKITGVRPKIQRNLEHYGKS